jgi:predicted ATPase
MTPMRRDLHAGVVTFLFSDVEGSTKLLHELGAEGYAEALAEHRRILRAAFAAHDGVEVDTQGDAFFVAFPSAPGAVAAAQQGLAGLAETPIRVRVGLHSGRPHLTEEGYVGEDVHLGARIAAAGHGGQVLLSKETRALAEVELTDLGEHRLKDFAEPVAIFQIGSERFPPLKTISNTNLPRPASSFLGRGREVAEVVSVLRGEARLLTLSGPGGSGKTRLAIEAASELVSEFKAGVFWVGLATIRDPAVVGERIAQTLGAKDGLAEHIGEREMLLLLDNLEQVVEAAPELAALVEACPSLRLLVTSRELLRVRGEIEYAVPPLAERDAVELFCTRAQLEPSDDIARLCRRLDSLPLAVELAAARTSVLSPAQILARLSERLDLLKGGRDAEARQQTLRATITWSHELLNEEEQRLFARLAVFSGGCTLDAAEAVAEADLDVLQSLVGRSLLRHTAERFWMLETIREYALERLEASGEAEELRRRHADHFLALAEEAEPRTREFTNEKEWLDRLEREQDNFRVALAQFETSGEGQQALQLAGALSGFWGMRGFVSEGWRRLERALSEDGRPTPARARALLGAADLGGLGRGDDDAVRFWAEQALALHRELGDDWGAAESLFFLAHAAADQREFASARELADESRRLFERAGDERYTTAAMWMLGWSHDGLGDAERSRGLYEDVRRRARAAGDSTMQSLVLYSLSEIAVRQSRVADAVPILEEAYRLDRETGNRWRLAATTCRLAWVLARLGRASAATRLLSGGKALFEEMGGTASFRDAEDEETLVLVRAKLGEAAFVRAWEEGRKLTADEAVELALESFD